MSDEKNDMSQMPEDLSDLTEMSPDASPASAGVRRVNKVPLYIGGALLGTFALIISLVAADRSKQQQAASEPSAVEALAASDRGGKGGGNTDMLAQAVIGQNKGEVGAIKPPSVPSNASGFGSQPAAANTLEVPIARPDNLEAPPRPIQAGSTAPQLNDPRNRVGGGGGSRDRDEVAERIREVKMKQLEEAVKSKSGIPVSFSRGPEAAKAASRDAASGDGSQRDRDAASARGQRPSSADLDPNAMFKDRLEAIKQSGILSSIQGAGGGAGAAGPALASNAGSSNKSAYGEFDKQRGDDRWRLDGQVQTPRSRFEVKTSFVIPATMLTGINSELQGQVIAQVSQNVYDTATGKYLLLPQGAKLVGAYSNNVAYGQSRVLVAWQRIVFPDGKAMDLGAMPGADAAGLAGLNDQVNNHYVRIFGSAFLMSAITAGITYSQQQNKAVSANSAPDANSVLSEALGQQLGQVTAQMIAKNLNIAPTLEIRPGMRFNVVVTKDLVFTKPYRGLDY